MKSKEQGASHAIAARQSPRFAGKVRCLLSLLVALVFFVGIAEGQRSGQGNLVEGSNLRLAEFYNPPHAAQMKSLLEGARAQRQPDGRILFTNAKLQTYHESGEGELI